MVWSGIGGSSQTLKSKSNPVGASLLAMAASHSTLMLNGRASSRAGSLPQGFVVLLVLRCQHLRRFRQLQLAEHQHSMALEQRCRHPFATDFHPTERPVVGQQVAA